MIYEVDTAEEKENMGGFVLIPEGLHDVQIVEVADKVTKVGDPMIAVKFEILNGDFKGKWLFDNIIIPRPGSPSFKIMGRTMHFLHVIGEPHEGKFKADPSNWVWEKLKVKVKHKVQEQGQNAGATVATIAAHDFFGEVVENGNGKEVFPDPDPQIPF